MDSFYPPLCCPGHSVHKSMGKRVLSSTGDVGEVQDTVLAVHLEMVERPGGTLSVGQVYLQPHGPPSHCSTSCRLICAAMWLKFNPFGRQ